MEDSPTFQLPILASIDVLSNGSASDRFKGRKVRLFVHPLATICLFSHPVMILSLSSPLYFKRHGVSIL